MNVKNALFVAVIRDNEKIDGHKKYNNIQCDRIIFY